MRRAVSFSFAIVSLACVVGCHDSRPSTPAHAEVASAPATPRRDARPRNVVLVTIDTLRADRLGAYGGAARTPVLDGLAERGLVLERAYAAAMLTNPSHASIMTSLYPRDHGVYDNESGIQDGTRTLASALRKHGLRTAAVLAFPHLNPAVSNLGQGFERVVTATRQERRADEQSRLALELVDELGDDEGFFLWIHYGDVHAPYDPPADIALRELGAATPIQQAVRVAPGFQKNNPWFQSAFKRMRTVEDFVARYVAEVEAVDRGFGALLDGLGARGVLDRTAFVITSDHGENLGEHGMYFHHGGLYRETVHVPLILAGPGVAKGRDGRMVEHVDIAPTILDLVGAARWEPMRGRSILAQRRGEILAREVAISEHMHGQLVSVRSAQGALIVHRKASKQFPSYVFTPGRRELYDYAADPRELTPLAVDSPIAEELDAALRGYLDAGLSMQPRPARDQDRESLQALGYID